MITGCVDIWENKVLRSSMGSIFRLPIVQKAKWQDIEDLIVSEEAAVFLADSRIPAEKTKNYLDADYVVEGKPIVLVVGGETRGLSNEAQKLITVAKHHAKIHVPLACGVESLNVAAAVAVLLFEIRRQRRNLSKMYSQQ
jgi:tRNA G18 (ribose-2'-O)-methylase SpoU